jgi:hypothetical protein
MVLLEKRTTQETGRTAGLYSEIGPVEVKDVGTDEATNI